MSDYRRPRGGGGGHGSGRGRGGGDDRRRHSYPQQQERQHGQQAPYSVGRSNQMSFVGRKRGREEEQQHEEDPKRVLITKLLKLGEPESERDTPERTIESAFKQLQFCIERNTEQLPELLLDAALELSAKTPNYAWLIGLVNGVDRGLVSSLVSIVGSSLAAALASGERHRYRMLLRLCAALVPAGVLSPGTVMAQLEALVQAANNAAGAGATDPSGRTWQPWADHLVYSAVAALPWGGAELSEGDAQGMERLVAGVDSYLQARPMNEDPELRPFYGSASSEDAAARSDSGAASFLPQLWAAVRDCQTNHGWAVASIPNLRPAFEQRLAQSASSSHDLQLAAVPDAPPAAQAAAGNAAAAAAALLSAYPPRGGVRLLAAQHTDGGRPALERFVAEEYILDTLAFMDGHRVDQAQTIARRLPLPWAYEGLLAETLLGQLLLLPSPPLPPVAYATLLMDVCRLNPGFPKYLSACMRECFVRMPFMDPQLRSRLSQYLAHHLSNFGFLWPWDKWAAVLQAPDSDPQRAFCAATLDRLVRLSFWAKVKQSLPPAFHALLGPQPGPRNLPTPTPFKPPPPPGAPPAAEGAANGDQNSTAAAAGGDTAMGDGTAAAAAGADAAAMETAGSMGVDEEDEQAREAAWASKILGALMHRRPAQHGTGATELMSRDDVVAWMQAVNLEERVGGPLPTLRALYRALLARGSKTYSHMCVQMERYAPDIARLVQEARADGEEALMDVTADVWEGDPQRMLMVFDRLMTLRFVSTASVVGWALRRAASRPAATAASAWELLYLTTDKAIARVSDMAEEIATQETVVAAAEDKAATAAAAAAGLAVKTDADAAGGVEDPVKAEEGAKKPRVVDFTVLATQQAAKAAEQGRELLMQMRAVLEANSTDKNETLMQAYHSLVDWASQEPPAQRAGVTSAEGGEDEAMATDDGADQAAAALASKQLRLAELRAYARTFAADTSQLLDRLLAEVLPEGGAVLEDVRHTLLGALRLPLDSMTD